MAFEIGDKVVYPNHGIGVVEDIQNESASPVGDFYKLRILSNATVVKVPVANVEGVGLRRVISTKDVERIFDLLENRKIETHSNWKGRYKDNSDKMRSGSIYDVAGVLKDLSFLSKKKSLSFREKRMLDRARFLIVSEVAEVAEEPQDLVEQKIDIALSRGMEAKKRGRTSLKTLLKKTTIAAMAENGRTEGAARKTRSRTASKAKNARGRKKPISISINRYCC
jgi:CarD family transcriptional regulator